MSDKLLCEICGKEAPDDARAILAAKFWCSATCSEIQKILDGA